MIKPTPPRGTTRVTGQGPANQQPCPGCGAMIARGLIACESCFRRVPGDLKRDFSATGARTDARKRVVATMRSWLRAQRTD